MARKKTVRPRRRRRNSHVSSKTFRSMSGRFTKKRKARRKSRKARTTSRRKSSHSGKRIRPVVIVSGGKFYRPRRSKAFKRPTRINGRRRRRSNPAVSIRNVFSMRNITRYLSIGGGMVAGNMVTSFVATGVLPFGGTTSIYPDSVQEMMAKARPVLGLANLLVGAFVASKVRNPMLKDAALGIAAYGGFDLFTQVLGMMGVTQLAGMDISGPFLGAGRFASQNRSYGAPAVVDGMDIPMVGEMEPDFADAF
jgi:hypothetical protein